MDEWTRAAILGAVQAATEFLPVSSSGHLLIGHRLLGAPASPLAFDVGLHVGTLVAVLLYFRRDWLRIGGAVHRRFWPGVPEAADDASAFQLGLFVMLATIPAVLAGGLGGDFIESQLRSPAVVAAMLIAGGLLLWCVDAVAERRTTQPLTGRRALTVGLWQVLALIPGVSRSGATLIGGRSVGLGRLDAIRFSFLLAAPVTLGAAALEVPSALAGGQLAAGPLLLGMSVAFVVGLGVIRFLLRYVTTRGYGVFAAYRILVGAGIFALLLGGWL